MIFRLLFSSSVLRSSLLLFLFKRGTSCQYIFTLSHSRGTSVTKFRAFHLCPTPSFPTTSHKRHVLLPISSFLNVYFLPYHFYFHIHSVLAESPRLDGQTSITDRGWDFSLHHHAHILSAHHLRSYAIDTGCSFTGTN